MKGSWIFVVCCGLTFHSALHAVCIGGDLKNFKDCKCLSGDCKSGAGKLGCFFGPIGADLTLTFQNGKWNGPGSFTLPTGFSFKGNFVNNEANGSGVVKFLDDNRSPVEYNGGWVESCAHGQGILKTSSFEYQGAFARGSFHGQGTFRPKSGTPIIGIFSEGWFCVRGNCTNGEGEGYEPRSGHTYKGSYVAGMRHGTGEYKAPNFTWKGNIAKNVNEGPGTLTLKDGSKYVGNLMNGTPQIGGKWYRPDGSLDKERTDQLE